MVAKFCAVLLLALLCCQTVFAQDVEKLIIDDFQDQTPPLIIVVNPNDLPETLFQAVESDGVVGGERDMQLTIVTGGNLQITTSSISGNTWNVANAKANVGSAFLQYDGVDGSATLNTDGLGGVDITANNGLRFRLLLESDLATFYTITVADVEGRTSESVIDVAGDDTTQEYVIDFDDFQGNADFTNVGAVEIEVELFTQTDAILSLFAVVGPNVPSPSNSPAPNPSASNSPAPNPSASNTPAPSSSLSNTPTPSPIVATWYTFDDDDEGVSPCGDEPSRKTYWVSDDDIIYYYFFGFNDGLDTISASSSSILAVCVSLIASAIFLVL